MILHTLPYQAVPNQIASGDSEAEQRGGEARGSHQAHNLGIGGSRGDYPPENPPLATRVGDDV